MKEKFVKFVVEKARGIRREARGSLGREVVPNLPGPQEIISLAKYSSEKRLPYCRQGEVGDNFPPR